MPHPDLTTVGSRRGSLRAGFASAVVAGLLVVAPATTCLTVVPALATCPARPAPLCRDFGLTRLKLEASGGRFDWRATLGPPTTAAELGTPTTSTGYSLCAWDSAGTLIDSDIAAAATCDGESCWRARGSSGLRYSDPAAAGGGVRSLSMKGDSASRTKLRARGRMEGGIGLPIEGSVTLQLLRSDSAICFESLVPASAFASGDADAASVKSTFDASVPVSPLASAGCGVAGSTYPPGVATIDVIDHDGLERSFRVFVPQTYSAASPTPVVLLLHGGFGSGAQIESSSRMLDVAGAEGFVVVSPDGVLPDGGVRAWNAGKCCGYPVTAGIDDVGFLAAVLDRLETALCVDTRRVYAVGMSNGSMLSHRLGCDLADRIRAIASVSGTDMTETCSPARPVPSLTIHGSDDANVPFDGGFGCGVAGVSFRSVPGTVGRWLERDGCDDEVSTTSIDGDASCASYTACAAGNAVELCTIDGGGHQWPGGVPPSGPGLPGCPFGYQTQSFSASQRAWNFFETHPVR